MQQVRTNYLRELQRQVNAPGSASAYSIPLLKFLYGTRDVETNMWVRAIPGAFNPAPLAGGLTAAQEAELRLMHAHVLNSLKEDMSPNQLEGVDADQAISNVTLDGRSVWEFTTVGQTVPGNIVASGNRIDNNVCGDLGRLYAVPMTSDQIFIPFRDPGDGTESLPDGAVSVTGPIDFRGYNAGDNWTDATISHSLDGTYAFVMVVKDYTDPYANPAAFTIGSGGVVTLSSA